MRICGDPGHGGPDSGAVGPGGTKEKDVNLAVTKLLAGYLERIAEVKLTRTDDRRLGVDENADLQARVAIAEQFRADIFISIHCNSGASTANGMEAFTTPGQGKADPIAEAIIKAWEKEFPGMKVRKDLTDGDSDKEAKFYVIRNTTMPAVLVELAFISNPSEEKLLKDPAWQDRAARAIAQGIANHAGVMLPTPTTLSDLVLILAGSKRIEGRLIDGKTWAPVAEIFQVLGIKYTWDGLTRTVKII